MLAFKRTLVSLDEEKRTAKMTTQQVEDELTVANAALTALNSRLSKERKSLGQQLRKRNAKLKQLQSSSTTLELVHADAKFAQATLEKAGGAHQKHQAMLEKLVAENEDLKSKCEQLLEQNQDTERMLSTLSADAEATAQLVEARIRTLAGTYLADSDASEWRDVISRIDKEVRRATEGVPRLLLKHHAVCRSLMQRSTSRASFSASAPNLLQTYVFYPDHIRNLIVQLDHEASNSRFLELLQLRAKYDVMFAALNEKFSRMLQDKVRMNTDIGAQPAMSWHAQVFDSRFGLIS